MRLARPSACLVLSLVVSCSSPHDPTWAPVVGIIEWNGESEDVVEAPAQANAGERFTIVVSTYGPSCVHPGRSQLETVESGIVVVTPFDVQERGACPADLVRIPRSVRLRLPVPGDYVLRIQGRSSPDLSTVFIDVPIRAL